MRMLLFGNFKILLFMVASISANVHSLELKCYQDSIYSMNLSAQFGEFKNQGQIGICYAEVGMQLGEAALFRKSAIKKSLSSAYLAANYCVKSTDFRLPRIDQQMRSFAEGKLQINDLDALKLYDGGAKDVVDQLVKLSKIPESSNDDSLNFKAARFQTGTDFDKALVNAAASGEFQELLSQVKAAEEQYPNLREELDKKWTIVDAAHKRLNALPKPQASSPKSVYDAYNQEVRTYNQLSDEYNALSASLKKVIEAINSGNQKIKDGISASVHAKACYPFQCYIDSALVKGGVQMPRLVADPLLSRIAEHDSTACTESVNQEILDKLLSRMCLGVPLYVGLNKTSKIKLVRPAGEVNSIDEGHAMTAVGFEEKSGVHYLVLRNSWGKDSMGFLPFSELCRIDSIAGVLNAEKISTEEQSEAEAVKTNESSERMYRQRRQDSKFFKMTHVTYELQNRLPASLPGAALDFSLEIQRSYFVIHP